ncbi:MAG: GNAT family N-acetyltransferase [Anaerolineae bacterium]
MAVCLKGTGRFIGFVCLNPGEKEGSREYNLGYILDSNYRGRGYGTEACRAMLGRAFGDLQADRVVSGTMMANVASVRLLQKLGFRTTGEGCFALSREEWERSIQG